MCVFLVNFNTAGAGVKLLRYTIPCFLTVYAQHYFMEDTLWIHVAREFPVCGIVSRDNNTFPKPLLDLTVLIFH